MSQITTPTVGATGWNTATDALIARHNVLDVAGGAASVDVALGLPSYASAATKRYDPTRSVYNLTATNIRTLRAKLGAALAGTGLCRITVVGDSGMAGNGATPGRTDPVAALADLFARFGYRAGGIAHAGNNNTTDARWTTTGWTGVSTSVPYISKSGSGSTATFVSDNPGTVVEILFQGQSAAFTYSIDGAGAVAVVPDGVTGPQLLTVTGLADARHTVAIASVTGTNLLVGVGVRATTGVLLQNAAIAGTTAADWAASTATAPLASALETDPDLVLVEVGINDAAAAVSTSAFQTSVASIVTQAQAGGADVVIVASQAPDTGVISTVTWNSYLTKLYAAADSTGAALLDLTDRFGRYTEWVADGVSADSYHFNAAGYAAKASAIAGTLLELAQPAALAPGAGVRVYALGAAQTVPNGTTPLCDFNVTEFNDDLTLYTVDLSGNAITVAQGGLYMVQWETQFAAAAGGGNRYSSIFVNGSFTRQVGLTAGGAEAAPVSVAKILRLAAGDVVTNVLYVDGDNVPVSSTALYETGLTLVRLGS